MSALVVRVGEKLLQSAVFVRCHFPACAIWKIAQFDIHDACPYEFLHPISEIFAHPPDLAVQSLREDNAKLPFSDPLHLAGARRRAKLYKRHTAG
jgi:hypothetical protein